MRILLASGLIFSFLSFHADIPANPLISDNRIEQLAPAYAKWGQIAMERTKKKYPDANITDYFHIGLDRKEKVSTEKFKLWLKEGNKEFAVFVHVTFNPETEELIDVSFRESRR